MKVIFTLSLFALGLNQFHAQNAPHVLIRYATVHIGNGEKIDNAYVSFKGNEFTRVTDANTARINLSDYDTIIDAAGKHIYPGFILMDSRLGLTEIDAVRATHDYEETGTYLPNVRALPAFNSESKIIATVRTNGILMAQIAPVGARISGTSSVVHFNGWNWTDATIRADEGLYLNWPSRYRHTGWWGEPGKAKASDDYNTQVNDLYDFFDEAVAYSTVSGQTPKNLRFEAMRRLFGNNARLYVRVDWAKDILDVVQFARHYKLKHVTIVGGSEAHLVTTELRENNISVVIDRVHKLPEHIDSPIDEPFEIPSLLSAEGISIAFATSGDMEAMISRNLPFHVGTAIAYGLEYEEAVKSITYNPAKLLGIDDHFGTVESGKSATFFLCDGDAFDMRSNKVSAAFVSGEQVDLFNHQEALYLKYKDRK